MLIDQLKIAEGSTIINLSFPSGTTFPTSVQIGEVFYRTDENQAYVYNGAEWDKITDVSASQYKSYDIPLQKTGTIPPSSTLMFFVAARQTTIPANFAGSYAAIGSISAATTFTIKRNNIAIGTLAFTAGGVETFSSSLEGDIVLLANDSLSIVSSAGTMPTDLAITIQAAIDGSPPAIDGSSSVVAGAVTSIAFTSTDLNVTGGPITSSGVIDLALKSTTVSPGSYNYASLTVDSKGRLTAASSGTPVTSFNSRTGAVSMTANDVISVLGLVPTDNEGTVTSVGLSSTDFAVSGGPITSSGNITANLNVTDVTAGSYTYSNITVDSKGRLTAASSGTPVTSFGGRSGDVSLTSGDIQGALGFLPASSLAQLGTVTLLNPAVGQVLTYSAGGVWRNVAAASSLPTQTGNTGKYLTTNGTAASWATIPAGNVGTVTSVGFSSSDMDVTNPTITSSGNISATLKAVNTTPGPFGYASIIVDEKGRVLMAEANSPVTSFNTRVGPVTLTSADVTTALGYTPGSGTGTVSSVNVAGGTTGLSFTGGPVTTTGTITLTGTLAVANGGTGGTTASAALTNLLPTQTGNTGKVLTTNGTVASWATPTVGTVTSVGLSSTDFAVSGGPITSSGNITANLNTTAVTAGSYTFGSFTVDSKGRLTAAASGTPVTSFNTRTGAVTLGLTDVTTALGFTPFSSASGIGSLPDVLLTAPATGEVLSFDLTTNKWKNVALASGLPAQSGMSGKLLTTNGTAASWGNAIGNLTVGSALTFLASPVSYPLQSVSTGTSGATLARFSNDTNVAQLVFVKSRGTTPGTYNGPVLNNDYLGLVIGYGDDGTTAGQGSSMAMFTTEAWNATSHGADVRFHTVPNGTVTRLERLRITQDGRLALGTTAAGAAGISVNNPLTGSTTAMGVRVNATIMSDVTGTAYGFRSTLNTEAAAFTLGNLSHYVVESSAGAGSTITTQVGYSVPSGMTAATTNIAFNGNLSYSATKTNWNFYALGDAWNTFAGNTGIGTYPALGQLLRVGGTGRITGATTAYSVLNNATVNSDVTSTAFGYSSHVTTSASAFTLPSLIHYNASPNTIGAGSTITNQYGFFANSNLTAATNNYGFFSNIQSGTGRWNFYALNSAANYFNGTTLIGSDVSTVAATSAQKLQVHASGGAGASFFRWANDAGAAAIRLVKSRSTSMGTFGTAPLNGDSLGEISFIGDNTTGTNVVNSAISSAAAEDFTATANGTNLRFTTTPIGSVTPAERLRINSTGNILVGTTTDDAVNKLQVSGSIAASTYATIGSSTPAAVYGATATLSLESGTRASISLIDRNTGTLPRDRTTPILQISKAPGTGFTTAVGVGVTLGSIQIGGSNGTGFGLGASISATTTAAMSSTSSSASLSFANTKIGDTTPGERMRIADYGNVLIRGGTGGGTWVDSATGASLQASHATFGSAAVLPFVTTITGTSGATIGLDFKAAGTWRLTLPTAGTTTLTMSTTAVWDGQECIVILQQPVAGNAQVVWPTSMISTCAALPMPAISTAGDKIDRFVFSFDSVSGKYMLIDAKIGF